jgi:hypothetical protein
VPPHGRLAGPHGTYEEDIAVGGHADHK